MYAIAAVVLGGISMSGGKGPCYFCSGGRPEN